MSTKPTKNIVIVLNSGAQRGGVERHIGDIIKGLSGKFSFTVCCEYGPMVEEYKSWGAKFMEIYPRFDIDPLFLFKFSKLLKRINADVVYAHELRSGFNSMLGAYLAGIPVRIYHVHTPIFQWRLPVWKKKTLFYFNILANKIAGNIFATMVIALTHEIKKEKVEKEGILSSKIKVVPNGIILSDFQLPMSKITKIKKDIRKSWGVGDRDFVIGNMSRLTEEKGHEILIKAFSKLPKDKFPYLVIAGDGHLKDYLYGLSLRLGISDRVKFLGVFLDQDKTKILSALDLFVFPTFAEGFGIVMIEAMASKIPVIASDLPVLREVAGNTISYFKVGSDDDLLNKIETFQPNSQIVERSFARVQSFYSMERFLFSYENIFNSL
jgi:glycosyltransferase involved in cell wall biosynthesis